MSKGPAYTGVMVLFLGVSCRLAQQGAVVSGLLIFSHSGSDFMWCSCREAEKSKQSKAAALGKNARPEATPGSREGKKRPKWDPTQPRKVGPVYVQILDQLPPPSASGKEPCP